MSISKILMLLPAVRGKSLAAGTNEVPEGATICYCNGRCTLINFSVVIRSCFAAGVKPTRHHTKKMLFFDCLPVRLTRLRRLEDNRRHSVWRWKVLPLLLSFFSPPFFVAAGPLLYRWCWMGWHEPTLRTHGGIKKNFKYIAFYSSTHRLLSTRHSKTITSRLSYASSNIISNHCR